MARLESVLKLLSESGLLGTAEQQTALTEYLEGASGRSVDGAALILALCERGCLTPDRAEELIAAINRFEPQRSRSATSPRRAPEPPSEGLPEGERIGNYIKTQKLGEGGMGEVWKGWDTQLNRWVALKFLKVSEPEERARFRREAQTSAKLSHPNIAAVYEAHPDYIVMQFIEGQTLAELPKNNSRQLVEIVRQAALAVHYAHEEGIIHRDLKPSNVMVVNNEKSGTARRMAARGSASPKPSVHVFVMDFGLAKAMDVDSSLSMSGWIAGTPNYMSPQQAQGSKDLDHRTDVYSLGATLYELLTGRPPFRNPKVYELLKQVIEEDPGSIRRLKATVDADLETIALKCLEKDPHRRYETALALAEDLERWLNGEAILAHPPSSFYRIRKKFVKRKALALVVAGALVLIAATLAVLIPKVWAARAELTVKERESSKYRHLQDRIKPIVGLIKETRPFFYIKDVDLQGKLQKIRRALSDLEDLVKDPEHARHADLWAMLGMGKYFLGEEDASERDLLKAAELSPGDGGINYYLGKLYLERTVRALLTGGEAGKENVLEASQGWSRKALDHLQRPVSSWEGAEDIDRHLAEAYRALAEDRLEDVLRLCREGLERFRGTVGREEYWYLMGVLLRGSEQIDAFTRALELRPYFAWGYFMRGVAYYQQKQPERALNDYAEAIRLNSRLAEAYFNRGVVLDEQGDLKAAIQAYTETLQVDPRFPKACFSRGLARYRLGDAEEAIRDYTEAIKINPRYVEAFINRGNARRTKGDLEEGISDYTEAIRLSPEAADAYTNRGNARQEKGDLEGALADYSEAIQKNSQRPEPYFGRGTVRHLKADLEGAIADYSEAIRLHPRYVEAYDRRGMARREKGDSKGALADYTHALRIDPRFAEAYLGRGIVLQNMNDAEPAAADFDEALRINPKLAGAFGARADLKLMQGDVQGAIADYTEAIRLDPRLTDAYANRAVARDAVGDAEGALHDFDVAIRTNPKHPKAYVGRGMVRQIQQDFKGALADFDEAIRVAPQCAQAYAARADLKKEMADVEGAIVDYEKALAFAPPVWEDRARIEEMLRNLKTRY